MTTPSTAVSWLPPGTPPSPALQTLLATLIEAWSVRWFAGSPVVLAPLTHGSVDLAWRALVEGMMLGAAPEAVVGVGARVIGVEGSDRSGRDRALLEEVGEECLADLRSRLTPLVEAPTTASWRPVSTVPTWSATIGGRDVGIALGLSDALFAALVRRTMPSQSSVPLGSGVDALACLEISVSAAVGRADLRVADLQALEVGDVVVLDRALADAVPLAVDGRALARGLARVVAARPQSSLEIVTAAA